MAKETLNNLETLGQIRGKINGNFDELYDAISLDGELFKYQIERTETSGNLTVALKNYLGDNPSASVPVKVQIGETVRTITSALSITINSGSNTYNAGSSELATKEIDYFVYLFYYDNAGGGARIDMGVSRIPYANTMGDFMYTDTNEKALKFNYGGVIPTSTLACNNIGRFNATLSASPYNWSIPATSVILNRPVYETRFLDWLPILIGASGGGGVLSISHARYKIVGDEVHIQSRSRITDKGTLAGSFRLQFPYTCKTTFDSISGGIYPSSSAISRGFCTVNANALTFTTASFASILNWTTASVNDEIFIGGIYQAN